MPLKIKTTVLRGKALIALTLNIEKIMSKTLEIHAINMNNYNQSFAIWSPLRSEWHFAMLSCQISPGFMHVNPISQMLSQK